MEIIFNNDDKFKLQRYSLDFVAKLPLLVKNNRGDWVRWLDTESLLKAYLNLLEKKRPERLLVGPFVDLIS